MATADSVKSKINALISKANDKTGKTDSTLTAAVDRLITGYGQGSGTGITPTGTIKITQNGDYDVTSYANANVAIPEVEQAVPEITVNEDGRIGYTITQEEGYVAGGTRFGTKTQPTQSAKTVTPGAAEKVAVAKGLFTTGDVRVAGDTNLVGENIKKGVSIFGITGVYEATGSNGEAEADDLSELHYWEKYVSGSDQIVETEVTDVTMSLYTSESNPWDTVDYADAIEISNGELQLVNPTNIILNNTTKDQVVGKYVLTSVDKVFYKIPSDAKMVFNSGSVTNIQSIVASKAYKLTANLSGSLLGVVVSANSTAYPEDGEQDGYRYVYMGTLSNAGGGDGTLPTLTNPGSATDLATGKQLIGSNGNIVTGSLFEVTAGDTLYGNNDPALSWRDDGKIETVGTYGVAGSGDGGIIRPGAKFAIRTPAEQYGDATAADVAAGKTFTSAAGLMLTGTGAGSSGLVMKTGSVTLDADTTSFDITTGLSSINALVVYNDKYGETSSTFLWAKSNVFSGRARVDVGSYVTTTYLSTEISGVSISNGIATCSQYSDSYPTIAGTYDWVAFGTM